MSNVIDLAAWRDRVRADLDLPPKGDDFGERLARINASMAKINNLMADLKRMSKERTP